MWRFILSHCSIRLFFSPGKTQYTDEKPKHKLKIYRKINSINPFNWIRLGKEIDAKKADKVIFAIGWHSLHRLWDDCKTV